MSLEILLHCKINSRTFGKTLLPMKLNVVVEIFYNFIIDIV